MRFQPLIDPTNSDKSPLQLRRQLHLSTVTAFFLNQLSEATVWYVAWPLFGSELRCDFVTAVRSVFIALKRGEWVAHNDQFDAGRFLL